MKALKLKIAGGTAALAAVIGGGAAVAATQLSPTEESDAIVQDAARNGKPALGPESEGRITMVEIGRAHV